MQFSGENLCEQVGMPISLEKTQWASSEMVFLGFLLSGKNMKISIPEAKRTCALNMIKKMVQTKKATVLEIQQLGGLLNFFHKAIHPGRTFTRRMYSIFEGGSVQKGNSIKLANGKVLKSFHHVSLNSEFRLDCQIWEKFLGNIESVSRPMIDFSENSIHTMNVYSDASLNESLGLGCTFDRFWTFAVSEKDFVKNFNPSIAYLELFALCTGIFTWAAELSNCRMYVFCDNKSARDMVNSTVSNCKHCMKLLRMLTLNNLRYNRRVFVKYVKSKDNILSDALSRLDFDKFFKHAPKNVQQFPAKLPEELWPLLKLWNEGIECNCEVHKFLP